MSYINAIVGLKWPPWICLQEALGRSMRHHALNELEARALSAAAIPNTKELQGLCRSDGSFWQSGKSLVWDVTVICPLADSYVASGACLEARSVVEQAAIKKIKQYYYFFHPRYSILLLFAPVVQNHRLKIKQWLDIALTRL